MPAPPLDLRTLDEERLAAWLVDRRWFGAKSREVAQAHVVETVALTPGGAGEGRASGRERSRAHSVPALALAVVEVRFPGGTHDLYQLLLGSRPAREGWTTGVLEDLDGHTVYDAFADPAACVVLAGMLSEGALVGTDAQVAFHWLDALPRPSEDPTVRPIGAEQSNTSLVLDEALVLKAFRHVEAGENPELEMLRFLSVHGFPHVAELGGWYEYSGEIMDATLGVVQRFVPGGRDGWELVLDGLGRDPAGVLPDLAQLGAVVGAMHTALASDDSDPAFAPEDPSEESLSLATATLEEQIEQLFLDLPADDDRLAAIAGRGEEVRDRVGLASHAGAVGRFIRHHGDFHLGQTLRVPALPGDGDGDGPSWLILDFEGEPARPLRERRRKRSPLRDVAGLLRSLSYAASASQLQRGVPAPAGWEEQARTAFLDAYLGAVDEALLPPGAAAIHAVLGTLELEKAIYELRYELDHRPDWVPIPAAAIAGLLAESPG